MSEQSEDAFESARTTTEAVRNRVAPRKLSALRTELAEPTLLDLGGKTQITVPAIVRRRWTPLGNDAVLALTAVTFEGDGLLLVPTSRAKPWLDSPARTHRSWPVSLQKAGNFEIPTQVRISWEGKTLARIDLGYCFLAIPQVAIPGLFQDIWGVEET